MRLYGTGTPTEPPRRLPVRDPHRADPHQLFILLFAADIVVAGLAALSGGVLPLKGDLPLVRLRRIHHLTVANDVDFRELVGADEFDAQHWGSVDRELLTHEMRPAADVGEDVVRGAVDTPLTECLHDAIPRSGGDPEIAI